MKKIIIVPLLILLSVVGCTSDQPTISGAKQVTTHNSTQNINKVTKELTIDNFVSALKSEGFTVTDKENYLALMLGAKEAYGITVNGLTVIFEVYDLDSKEPAIINILKEVKESGTITISTAKMKTIMIRDVALQVEEREGRDKIIKVFNSFK